MSAIWQRHNTANIAPNFKKLLHKERAQRIKYCVNSFLRKTIPMRSFFLVCSCGMIIIANCAFNQSIRSNKTTSVKSLKFKIDLSDKDQLLAADSLGCELTRRLLIYADERKDFKLVKSTDSSGYTFNILITGFKITPYDSLVAQSQIRKSIENDYDKKNDSISANYQPNTTGKLIAANIAANALNVLSIPMGFVSISVITDVPDDGPKRIAPNKKDQQKLNETVRTSFLTYQAKLFDSTGNIDWELSGTEKYDLTGVISDREQLKVLVNNVVLKFEDQMPFLRIKK